MADHSLSTPAENGNTQLSLFEQDELKHHETIIERGFQTFYEVGMSLLAIRDDRLYRGDYHTFEEYCQGRWLMTRQYANRLIAASEVIENLETIVSKPTNENQVKPLVALSVEQQREAWQEALDTAPNGKITGAHVQAIVDQMLDPAPSALHNEIPVALLPPIENGGRQKPKINRAGNEYVPQGFDACQTPPYAIDPLCPYLDTNWTFWEPAAGEGLLREALYDCGVKNVLSSDLLTEQNFFEYTPAEQWDCIVTNPPYSLKYRWLERCFELGKPFALLLPVETLGAKSAQVLFRQYDIEVIFMDRRINFKMPNIGWEGSAAQFPTAWFTWGLNIGQQMVFAEVTRND